METVYNMDLTKKEAETLADGRWFKENRRKIVPFFVGAFALVITTGYFYGWALFILVAYFGLGTLLYFKGTRKARRKLFEGTE